MKSFYFLILLGFKVFMLADLSYTLFILPWSAIGYRKNNSPVRSLTVDEYSLLKKYYPKEKFDSGVWMLEGLHCSAASLGCWEGQNLINGVPVIFHSSAESALKRGGDNRVELAMGKRKAYVIGLNKEYCMTENAGRLESNQRFWDQWMQGLAGKIEGYSDVVILNQRESNKRENFYRAYLYAPEFISGDFLRFFGSFLSLVGLVFFGFYFFSDFYFNYFSQYVFFFLGLLGAFLVCLPAYLVSKPEKINVIQGKYAGLKGGCIEVGGLNVRVNEHGESYLSRLSCGSLVTVEVWVNSNMAVSVDSESFITDEVLEKSREPLKAPAIMMVLFFCSTVALFELSGNMIDFGESCFLYSFLMTIVFFLIFLFKFNFRPFDGRF
ncbi:hypothetical protein LG331_03780 [Vreelandella aquamarina]|uniref:hypothetical protein n=1 Tax=Vreelandella aquamarina TaxID=77097 RepID=UPI00384D81B7